jgi:hypothetical protein
VTVVDIGWDVWPLTALGTRLGPLLWATGSPAETFPVLVTRSTAPSVALAEGVLARYGNSVRHQGVVDLHGVVSLGDRGRWPTRVHAVMGRELSLVAGRAHFVAMSPEAVVSGWTTEPAPVSSLRAATALLNSVPGLTARAPRPGSNRHPARWSGWGRAR